MEVGTIDHLINKFDVYLEYAFNDFYADWKSGKYKKFADCPNYDELKTLIDSVNILRKYYSWESITIKGMVDLRED